jgi:glycosyltransferase involved in cell wall biosynthesis
MVGRLVSYKKFDLAIRVFNELGWPLKIAGTGIEAARLKRSAGKNVEFLGLVNDDRLAELYSKSKALIFPQEEDFGIVPLEAMAAGRPVIAYRGGGAVETVAEVTTGLFFDEQSERSLWEALGRFEKTVFDPYACRAQAEKFDVSVFKEKILNILAPSA